MVATFARFLTIAALCLSLGFQWIALQSVAWTTMLIQNSKSTSLCRAVKQTFDGAHPCSLCHVVQTGKASEEKTNLQTAPSKIDIVAVVQIVRISRASNSLRYEIGDSIYSVLAQAPPVPPPRANLRFA